MSIEITENIIRGSIVKQIKNAYPDITVYDERIEEGFERPSFHISRIDNIHTNGLVGGAFKRGNNNYRYSIKYFTNQKYQIVEDINNKIDKLKEIFEYLELVNIEEGNIIKEYNRINSCVATIIDDVLIFEIQFNIDTIVVTNVSKVQENVLTTELK